MVDEAGDVWDMYVDRSVVGDKPNVLTEEEILAKLRERKFLAPPRDILQAGTKLHFTRLKSLSQKLAMGLLSEKEAIKRGIKRDKPGKDDLIHLVQITNEDLQKSHPLTFEDDTNVSDYSAGEIEESLLTKVGIILDDSKVAGLQNISQAEGITRDPATESIWWARQVPPDSMVGFVLVDEPGRLREGMSRVVSFHEIEAARTNTINQLRETILPYHNVPIYSQATGEVLLTVKNP